MRFDLKYTAQIKCPCMGCDKRSVEPLCRNEFDEWMAYQAQVVKCREARVADRLATMYPEDRVFVPKKKRRDW